MVRTLIVASILLVLPAVSRAQDATLTGTVEDSSGGVLPGVTITALHEASGNTFVAVTDAAGTFRLPVRTGAIRLSAELPGFAAPRCRSSRTSCSPAGATRSSIRTST